MSATSSIARFRRRIAAAAFALTAAASLLGTANADAWVTATGSRIDRVAAERHGEQVRVQVPKVVACDASSLGRARQPRRNARAQKLTTCPTVVPPSTMNSVPVEKLASATK